LTLYRLSFQVRNIMVNKSDTTYDCSTDIGPPIVEHRPNSKPDTSSDVNRAELPILSLTEHYIRTHGTNQWDGPKCVAHTTKEHA